MNIIKINKKLIINFLKIILSVAFMYVILYYFFGKNSESLQRDLVKVDYKYVVLSIIFGAWAYVNRGLRWIVLIDALGYKSSKINTVSAVSVGYFTNLFIPRAGEISRCTALSKTSHIPVVQLLQQRLPIHLLKILHNLYLLALGTSSK